MKQISRRDFIKYGIGAGTAVAVISLGSWRIADLLAGNAKTITQSLTVSITDAVKEMSTHNSINEAKAYFWIYKMSTKGPDIPAECPGPTIVAIKGDTIEFTITNNLDEPHALYAEGFDSGPIDPGQTITKSFTFKRSGAFMYYDNLNSPVNRVMGLHGAIIVLPSAAAEGHKFTPYDYPTPLVQEVFDSFGTAKYPGLAWQEGDPATYVTPFRQYVWLHHQVSSKLFAEVGRLPPGVLYNPDEFIEKMTNAPFKKNNNENLTRDIGYTPDYFTIAGQGGFFSHFSPYVTPQGRVGEPVVIHAMNAGLWSHSLHIHANHCYVTSVNGVVQKNPLWLDTHTMRPMEMFDYTLPFMRPPDIPNDRGIGRADTPLVNPGNGKPVYPPIEEFEIYLPKSKSAKDINGNNIDLKQRQSPLCYPMHDHSEPTQTAQGGNYPMGSLSGVYIVGDRNTMMDFPMDEDFAMMFRNIRGISETAPAAGFPPDEPKKM